MAPHASITLVSSSLKLQYFTIDEHDLTVISMDFILIKPYKTNHIILGVS